MNQSFKKQKIITPFFVILTELKLSSSYKNKIITIINNNIISRTTVCSVAHILLRFQQTNNGSI